MPRNLAPPSVNPIVVIPARLGSSRLPGKPLAQINGEPMIVHVWRRAIAAGIGPVLVACAEEAIAEAIGRIDGEAILTDPALPSGSDRVFAAIESADPTRAHDVVVNLQADLPAIPPAYLAQALNPLADPGFAVGTLVAPIENAGHTRSESIVKAACAFAPGQGIAAALYFSRTPVPWGRGPLWHHIGIYAWRREALARFVVLPPTPLERREKLEQLRALEAGMRIGCVRVDHAPLGVDTPEDLARIRATFAEAGP